MSKTSFDSELPLIIAEAQVENKGKITLVMVLDTGASYTIIPYEVADAIGCDPTASSKRTRLITGSGVEMAPVVKVKSIKSLGKELKNFEVACHNLPQESLVDGLLGLNFLKHFDLSVDFKKGIIELK